MAVFGPGTRRGQRWARIPHTGTFNANPLSAAAGLALLGHVADGAAQRQAQAAAEQLAAGVNRAAEANRVDVCLYTNATSIYHVLIGARAAGLEARRYQLGAYVGAGGLYCAAGVLLAGVVSTPSAFQGDQYLLPSVAAVVLGGTSLLGGRGSVVASAVAALFITQLDQFVLTTGAKDAVQNLVEAAALAAGLAIYSVPWRRVFDWSRGKRDDEEGGVPVSADLGRPSQGKQGAELAPEPNK